MSLRKLNQFHSPLADVRVTIYRDAEYNEFQVRLEGNPDATYFTDSRQDATDTALVMFTEAVDKKCGK